VVLSCRAGVPGEPAGVRRIRRQIRGIPGRLAGHPVAWTAWRMTWVTTDGSEMRDRCPASMSVMWAPARLAMNVSSAGGMIWSAVPITAQDGMVFQAGGPDGSVNAPAVSGRWLAAMTAAWLRAGRWRSIREPNPA
jgi:hypothetical protein